ncbi:MAG: hypothetical protein ACHQQS_13070 [Thermoanaerobaculales bacterium]
MGTNDPSRDPVARLSHAQLSTMGALLQALAAPGGAGTGEEVARPPLSAFNQLRDEQIRAAKAFLLALPQTPREYPRIATDRNADHRSYALRRAGECLMAAVASCAVGWQYYFEVEATGDAGVRSEDPRLWALIDEHAGWVRKLSEVLVDLVLFAQANTQIQFQLYLVTEALE